MALTGQGLRVAAYRQRATFARRWSGYLALILLIGLVGGLALGSVAAARRTQSSFATYLASTNPSDLGISVFGGPSSGGGSVPVYSRSATAAIARLPGVKHVEAAVPIAAAPLDAHGAPELEAINDIQPVASVDGLFFDQDRLAVVAGRPADPRKADQVVMTALAAHLLGVHVGEVIHYGFYDSQQESEPGFGTAAVPPLFRVDATLVGLVQVNNAVVEDDIDRYPTFEFFTPALGREIVADSGLGTEGAVTYGLQLDQGNRGVLAVEREFSSVAPPGNTVAFHDTGNVEVKVDRTVKPLVIALGVFGGVALLAALLIAVQLISRQLGEAAGDLEVLRAFGADQTAMMGDSLIGLAASIVAGSLLAAGVAVALSPLAPLGPVRPVYPDPGIAVDWTVLGIGVGILVAVLGVAALVLAYRGTPYRAAPACTGHGAQRLQNGGSGGLVRSPRTDTGRGPVRPRAGPGPHRGTGAVDHVGRSTGRGTGGGHAHLRQRAAVTGLPADVVRVELHLPAQCQQHHTPAVPPPPRPRPRRHRVGRVRLQRGRDRRPGHPLPLRLRPLHPESPHQSSHPERPRRRREPPDRSGRRHPGPAPQTSRRHRVGLLRNARGRTGVRSADHLRGGGDGDPARRRLLQRHRRPHVDGDRGTHFGVGPAPGASNRRRRVPSPCSTGPTWSSSACGPA